MEIDFEEVFSDKSHIEDVDNAFDAHLEVIDEFGNQFDTLLEVIDGFGDPFKQCANEYLEKAKSLAYGAIFPFCVRHRKNREKHIYTLVHHPMKVEV